MFLLDRFRLPSTRMEKYPCLEMTDYFLAEEEAEKHCTKTFHLKDSSNSSQILWTLPSSDGLYSHKAWKVDELLKMKADLNSVKAQLEYYDIESWHRHTHVCNPAHRISYSVRCKAKPELLTQAFLKFYEILHAFPIIPEESELPDEVLDSLHLCEAPGAFIIALNHFLALQRPNVKWQWLGNTLNPHFEGTPPSECIADDRFILHTLDNWCFGKDETGDLMNADYLEQLIERLGGKKVNLVTADGSIDCQGNPSEQESMTHSLHFCEVYSALCALKAGGSLVLKKFTFFEAESVSIMYLISCCFDQVYVYKPITSKLGNSEVYIVAIGYKPPQCLSQYLGELHKFYDKQVLDTTLFSQEQIPSSFLTQIINCCTFFKSHQVGAIQRNIHLYNNESEWSDQYCNLLKSFVLNKYLENNVCRAIEPSKKIVPHKLDWDREITPEGNAAKWGGQIMKKPKSQRLKFLNDHFDSLKQFYSSVIVNGTSKPNSFMYRSKEYSQEDSILLSLNLKEGKPFHFVYVSRFCNVNLMQIYVHYFMECITKAELDKVQSHHFTELEICKNDDYKTLVACKNEKIKVVVSKECPRAMVLDEGYFTAPHACHKAFDELLNLLKEGKIGEGSDVAILNCPLFTRLQIGLLFATSSLFEKVIFCEPVDAHEGTPFFILTNFTSIPKGKLLINALMRKGWYSDEARGTTNQILPLQVMIESLLHIAVCRYNALYCISNIDSLKIIQG